MNSNQCKHGFNVDSNGNHIIPKEKSTAELTDEANKLLPAVNTVEPNTKLEEKKDGTVKELARLLEDY